MNVRPLRRLVSDISRKAHASFTPPSDELPEDIALRRGNTRRRIRAQPEEGIVNSLTVQRVIDETDATFGIHVLADTREPLPVAVMTEEARRVPPFEEPRLMHLRVLDMKPSVQLPVTDAHQFDGL